MSKLKQSNETPPTEKPAAPSTVTKRKMTPKEAARRVQEVMLGSGQDKLSYTFKALDNNSSESKVRTWAIRPQMHDASDMGKYWLDLNYASLVRVVAPTSESMEGASDEAEFTRGFRFTESVYGFKKELRVKLGTEQQEQMSAIVQGVLSSWGKHFNVDTSYVYNEMFGHLGQDHLVEGMRPLRDFESYQYIQLDNKYQNPAPWASYVYGTTDELYIGANLAYPNATCLKVVDEKDRMYGPVEENGVTVYSEEGIAFGDIAQYRAFVGSEFLRSRDYTWTVRALIHPQTITWRMGNNMADRSRPDGAPVVYPVIHWAVKGGVLCKRTPFDASQLREKDVLEDAVSNFVFSVAPMKPVKKARVAKPKEDDEDEEDDATAPVEEAQGNDS